MQSKPDYHAGIHPVLTSFADECVAALARLIAYIGALILLGIVGLQLWDELPVVGIIEPPGKPGWTVASRSRPDFAADRLIRLKNQRLTRFLGTRRRP